MKSRAIQNLLIVTALIVAGCGQQRDSLHEIDPEQPAYWPANLDDAAAKIESRYQQLISKNSSAANSATVKELQDLIHWLPEIAADTKLNESQWNKIYSASNAINNRLTRRNNDLLDIQQDLYKLIELLHHSYLKAIELEQNI